MISLFKVSCVLVILMASLAHAIEQTGWSSKDRAVWTAAQSFLELGHSGHAPQYSNSYRYTIQPSMEQAEIAWNYAYRPSAGPVYRAFHQDSPKSVYILTKLPSSHVLVNTAWGLNDGTPKNAFLFWRVDKEKHRGQLKFNHKLLGFDAWAAGAPIGENYSLQTVLDDLARRP